MAQLSKQALKVGNNTSFPNNNTNYITPAILREFNTDMIDSLVDENTYNADSSSWNQQIEAVSASAAYAASNTGSLLLTASVNLNTITFTKGDASQFSLTVNTGSGGGGTTDISSLNAFTASQLIINAAIGVSTGSLNTFTASAANSISLLNVSTASQQTSINALNSFTSSQDTKNATLASYTSSNDSKWNTLGLLTGSYATTGSNQFNGSQSISGSVTLSGSLRNVDYVDFNTASAVPTWKSGRVFWDNTDSCLAVYNVEADITLQVGQEQWVKARNNTGVTIANGAAVRLVGALGDNPLIVLAQSIQVSGSANTDNQILGIATHPIETGTNGYVTTLGNVRGLNTDAFNEGDVLWVSSSAGLLTNVIPAAPYERIPVATVIKKGPGGSGIIYVAPIPPIDFATLSSVEISGDYTNNDIWIYEGNVWKHKSKSDIGLTTTASFNAYTSSANSRLTSLEAATSSYATSAITGSSLVTASVNLNTITFTKGDASTFAITVNTGSGAAGTDISSLNAFTQSQDTKNSTLASYTGSNDTKWNTLGDQTGSYATTSSLNAYTASTDSRLDNLEAATSSYVTSAITGSSLVTASVNLNTITFTKGDSTTFNITVDTGSVDITALNEFTASASNSISLLSAETASYAVKSTSNSFTGSQIVSGSLTITGSAFGDVVPITIASNTASMDLSAGNYFTLTLADSTNTHITATNIKPGLSATLVITTGTASSASLAPILLQPSGSAYSASLGSGKADVLSLVSVGTANAYVVSTLNMI